MRCDRPVPPHGCRTQQHGVLGWPPPTLLHSWPHVDTNRSQLGRWIGVPSAPIDAICFFVLNRRPAGSESLCGLLPLERVPLPSDVTRQTTSLGRVATTPAKWPMAPYLLCNALIRGLAGVVQSSLVDRGFVHHFDAWPEHLLLRHHTVACHVGLSFSPFHSSPGLVIVCSMSWMCGWRDMHWDNARAPTCRHEVVNVGVSLLATTFACRRKLAPRVSAPWHCATNHGTRAGANFHWVQSSRSPWAASRFRSTPTHRQFPHLSSVHEAAMAITPTRGRRLI